MNNLNNYPVLIYFLTTELHNDYLNAAIRNFNEGFVEFTLGSRIYKELLKNDYDGSLGMLYLDEEENMGRIELNDEFIEYIKAISIL